MAERGSAPVHRVSRVPIAVTGMGCWYPGARNPIELWENILSRRLEFRDIPDTRLPLRDYYDASGQSLDHTYARRAAVLDGFSFDWASERIPKSMYESTDVVHWLALEVARSALRDAGFEQVSTGSSTGVFVGNTLTGDVTRANCLRLRWPFVRRSLEAAANARGLPAEATEALAATMEQLYKSVYPVPTEDSLAGGLANTIAGRICNYFDLHGGGYIVDGACSSSLLAVCTAARALSAGDVDVALAGGIDISIDPFELVGFARAGALSSGDMHVYDRRACGFIPGEGCGFVVLKRLDDARRNDDNIYAVVRGWGISSDGKGGIMAPASSGQELAIRRAYVDAGYSSADLDFVEGHGTGTPVGDQVELEAIAASMDASRNADERRTGVTSLKSIIGHTKAAAGIGAFIKAAIAVNRRVLPPTGSCSHPNETFKRHATTLYPIVHGKVLGREKRMRAGVSAMGFGGINSHVTLESSDAPAATPKEWIETALDDRALLASHQSCELFVFAADTVPQLIEDVRVWGESANQLSVGDLVDLAAHMSREVANTAPIRAAVIAGTPHEFAEQLAALESLLSTYPPDTGEVTSNRQQTVWISNRCQRSRVGFVFPGQGSQQLLMAQALVGRFPWAREMFDQADRIQSENGRPLVSPALFPDTDRALDPRELESFQQKLARTEVAQPAICAASAVFATFLSHLNIHPVAVGGHSLGELTAFHIAGAYDFETLLKLVSLRGEAMSATSDRPGAMAALNCSVDQAEELLADCPGYVVVANVNSPQQVVISGDEKSVLEALKTATDKEIHGQRLRVSNAFHSELVEDAARVLRNEASVPARPMQLEISLVSCMDGTDVEAEVDLPAYFAKQILSRVDYQAMVESLEPRCDMIIEVGPGRVLSGLADGILSWSDVACLPIASREDAAVDLNTVIARAFTHGIDVDFAALYERRLVRPFVPVAERKFIGNPCERPFADVGQVDHLAFGDVAQATGDFETALRESTDVTPEDLAAYLGQRAEFLVDVVSADLRSLHKVQRPVQRADDPEQPQAIEHQAPIADPPPTPTDQPSTKETVQDDLAELIVDLVHRRTGFPIESISMDARLLDDLNLDSIKAGDIIASAARRIGALGVIDPASLANATLEDVVTAVRNASDNPNENQTSPDPNPTPKSNDAPPTRSAEKLPPDVPTWVRTFAVDFVQAPWECDAKPDLSERCYRVLHESSEAELAAAIAQRLTHRNARVELTTYTDSRTAGDVIDDVTHVVAVSPRQMDAYESHERLQTMIERMRHSVALTNPTGAARPIAGVVFVQWGGGRFGTGGTFAIEGCSTAGFARSLHLETMDLEVRVIDLATELSSEEAAAAVVLELGGDEKFRAAGYDATATRFEPRHRLAQPSMDSPSELELTSRDIVIVTGGARGITALCVHELARHSNATFVLVGSSPHPSRTDSDAADEIAKTIARIEALQCRCEYYSCDITERDAVLQLVEQVESQLGPVTAVIHGAGRNHPQLAGRVGEAEAMLEVSPKILGALHLIDALGGRDLRAFIGLTSIIGVTGIPGNAWYAFSNEVLDLLLRQYAQRHPQTLVRSIAFSAWSGVGMGAQPQVADHLRRMGVGLIAPDEGVARFQQCLERDPQDLQVIVTGALGQLDTWRPLVAESPPQRLRFIEQTVRFEPGVELVTRSRLTLQKDPYLKDHCYQGSYLFPAVFGLEAMAQAAAYVLGDDSPNIARIEDIQLERPILLGEDGAVEIEIRAEAHEQVATGEHVVHVVIRSETTGFGIDHFAANVVVGASPISPEEHVVTGEPLRIDPSADLYSGILFQGPVFQRWRKTFALNERRLIFDVEHDDSSADAREVFEAGLEQSLLLGDPFCRDVLLQSVQVLMPQQVGLPLSIERIEFFGPSGRRADDSGTANNRLATRNVRSVLHQVARQVGEENHCEVVAMDESGRVVERLTGYRVKVLQIESKNPTAAQLADLETFDQATLSAYLDKELPSFDLQRPTLLLRRLPQLHSLQREERREIERPVMIDALVEHCQGPDVRQSNSGVGGMQGRQNAPLDIDVAWLETGRPVVRGNDAADAQVSLSHDEDYCLCVANTGRTGCDIAPITARSEAQWLALLGPQNETTFHELVQAGDSLDEAGTRIWAGVESARKALDADDPIALNIDKRHGTSVSFMAAGLNRNTPVFTTSVSLRRHPMRVVAFVSPRTQRPPKQTLKHRELTPGENRELENFRALGKWDGPQDQAVFEHRFVVTFKECATRSRRVQSSQYLNWLGMMRENALLYLVPDLMLKLADGTSGMATNWTDIDISGEAMTGDVVQARLWMETMDDASVCLCCDFARVLKGERLERLAYCRQATTWVHLHDREEPTREPFPTFLADAFRSMAPRSDRAIVLPDLPKGLGRFDALRSALREQTNGSKRLVRTDEFDTCLDDANLVGNIYYARYFAWQLRACDLFLHSAVPDIVLNTNDVREFLPLRSRIDFMRDAFPFDRIRTEMSVGRLTESAAALEFTFHRILPNGQSQKLAVGEQDVVWVRRAGNTSPVPVPFPSPVRAAFVGEREFKEA